MRFQPINRGRLMWMVMVMCGCLAGRFTPTHAQQVTAFPDIPRIDVHAHVGEDPSLIERYLALRDLLKSAHQVDLAMWVNLGTHDTPTPDLARVQSLSQGRMVSAISDYRPHTGLTIAAEELPRWHEQGYVGYKIWAGPWHRRLQPDQEGHRYVDDPAHEATFRQMEAIQMVGASIHIADPNGPFGNRTPWLADPIEYWTQIQAWRNVLVRHPNLIVVVAHGNWLVCQDAQLDYLRYLLATFPNLYIDLAATFQYYHLVDTANLQAFMTEWADRILFGTDIGRLQDAAAVKSRVAAYDRCFRILETDQQVEGGFFGMNPTRGLALPREVLEKIYYRNALRVYPRLREAFLKLGYTVP
jgi:predicted TIM-barrel fold metal-dependent hydrolase